jgi:hypothetical protein
MSFIQDLTENIRYLIEPQVVQKLQKPMDYDDEFKKSAKTTEFGSPRDDDLLDVDAFSSSNFYTVYQADRPDDKTVNDLILKYRRMGQISYVQKAINEVVGECIFKDNLSGNQVAVDFNDPQNKLSDKVKERIIEEFDGLLDIMDFDDRGDDFFRQWYIDGRLLVQVILDKKNTAKGIEKTKIMSPLFLKRNYDVKSNTYYYVYETDSVKTNPYGQDTSGSKQEMIPDELVIFVSSGLYESEKKIPISFIHPAMKEINRLDTLEDHWLIYRIVRAPERRVFYVDPGNLPPKKAKELLNNVIATYKQKKLYDESTGTLRSRQQHPSILEDFFLLRRNGKGTEIDTIPGGGQGLGDVEELKYFEMKAARALNVPYSRLNSEDRAGSPSVALTGNEITREEIQFEKFVNKLRGRFNVLFKELLKKQLIYKKVIDINEWDSIKRKIKFVYKSDAQFAQAKRIQSLQNKLDILRDAEEYVGKYLTRKMIHKDIFGRTDDEIKKLESQVEVEKSKYSDDDSDDGGGFG